MNDLFTPREIELLLQRARDRGAASNRAAQGRNVESFDFHRAGQLATAQVSSLSKLHEEFAKQLGRSLSELLRVACEVQLVGAKQTTYEEFASRIPETTHLGAFRIQSPEGHAVVQADLAVVLPRRVPQAEGCRGSLQLSLVTEFICSPQECEQPAAGIKNNLA